MRLTLLIAITFLLLFVSAQLTAAETTRPTVLVFETTKGEGADKTLAESATKALRAYLRDTGRIEVALFERESPTVLRAIMDKQLTADQVASYSSRAQRLEVAQVLQYSYAAGAEISVKDSVVHVKLWIGQVDGGKRGSWETTGAAASGGASARDLDNAVQSATSAAVREIERQALSTLPRAASTDAFAPTNSDVPSVQTKALTAADYAAQAEASIQAGNLALAIEQYSQAVSEEPSNPSLRIKLADAYALKGLYKEAEDTLGRAAMVGADAALIAAAKSRIEQLKSGKAASGASTPDKATTPPPTAADDTTSKPANPAAAAVAKMIEGDKLWNEGKQDEAAEAYRDSIKLNPGDWRAYERLAAVNAQMSLFAESRKALEQLNKLQPEPDAKVVSIRYELFRKAFDHHFGDILRKYDSDTAGFNKQSITREAYYNSIKALAARLESMAKFLDVLTVPPEKKPANLRRSLACGLLAQAATNLLDYLESNSEEARLNATVFADQARKETETAAKLESTKAVVEAAPPTEEQPPTDELQP